MEQNIFLFYIRYMSVYFSGVNRAVSKNFLDAVSIPASVREYSEVRMEYWKNIISQCQNRTEGQSAKQWMDANGICEGTYYLWQKKDPPTDI